MFPVCTITSSYVDSNGRYKEFHFRNESRKDLFLKTLYAIGLNIPFSEETLMTVPTKELLIELEKDPEDYARESISWADDAYRCYRNSHLTEAEWAYIHSVSC